MQAKVSAYRFSGYELQVLRKKLVFVDTHKEIDISERQFTLLRLLCEASPEALDKYTLTNEIWPKTEVSDWSLSRLISDTRAVLDDDGESQSIIKTQRGIGFAISDVIRLSSIVENIQSPPERKYLLWSSLFTVLIGVCALFWYFSAKHQQQSQLAEAMQSLSVYQDNAYTAFVAQVNRRNELVSMMEKRLGIERNEQFEKFFARYFEKMNQQEHFVCSQMRAMTDTGIMQNNQNILNVLNQHPQIFEEITQARALQQHLNFWLNKYRSVFKKREDMCLLYVGVEDKVPYPSGIDQKVKEWLASKGTS